MSEPVDTNDFSDDHSGPRPARPRRRPRQQIGSLQIAFAALLSIGLLLVINFSGRIARGQQIETERRKLQATIDVLQQERLALLRERDYAADDAYVEQWAHTDGKMVREGEVLVIPVPAAGQSTPTPVPTRIPLETRADDEPDAENWRLWWNLFFDGDPPF